MMEWNDIGIKDVDDVRRCLAAGATPDELERLFGEQIRPLLADVGGDPDPDPEILHTIVCDNTDRELCDCADYPPEPS